jgi:hypothetical protein
VSDKGTRLLVAGFVGGVAAGFAAWSLHQHVHRRDLFSARTLNRYSALGHLGGRRDVGAARVLGDYLRWETHPRLRRQGRHLLHRFEQRLEA